jgi:hypothetical protein
MMGAAGDDMDEGEEGEGVPVQYVQMTPEEEEAVNRVLLM